jgi:aquaporin Z
MSYPLDRKLAVEFIGMFLFVFTVGMATNKAGAGSLAPLAIGGSLMIAVFAGGHISGGAFNPAIAIGAMVTGLLQWSHIWIYLLADFLGGAAAAYAFLWVLPGEKATGDIEAASTEGALEVNPD